MIFEFLDAKLERIATYTDTTLVSGVIRRERVDRMIVDSMDAEFTLEMMDIIKEATYVMHGDSDRFRVNQLFRKMEIVTKNTVRLTGTSQTLDRAGEIPFTYDGTGSFYEKLSEEGAKIGFTVQVDSSLPEKFVYDEMLKYIAEEPTLKDVVEAVAQVIGGLAEFGTVIDGDKVAQTTLTISAKLGREYKDALVYGLNIESLRVEERVEDIMTGVEYTGMEIERSDGTKYTLTLDNTDRSLPRDYELPKTGRTARLTNYTDSVGVVHHLLEDLDSTRTYGRFTKRVGVVAEPVFETFSNADIPTVEDLIDESIKELDGRNIPRTQYEIVASVKGLDVADDLGIQVPHLGIRGIMPVLSVEYEMGRGDECRITVGEHLPTELDRRFENISTGSGGADTNRGKLLTTVVHPRSFVYTSWEHLLPAGDTDMGGNVQWVAGLSEPMYPELYDYFLNFEYVINEDYEAVAVDIGLNTDGFTSPQNARNLSGNGFLTYFGTKVADLSIEGKSGSVEMRLNDYWNFMHADTYTGGVSTTRVSSTGILEIKAENYVYPIVTIRMATGLEFTLNFMDYQRFTPLTDEGREEVSGYLKNFTITKHEMA